MTKPKLRTVQNDESGLGKPLPLLLSKIEPLRDQPRRYFNPKETEKLADNIQKEGQKTPVKVCWHPTKLDTFILIGGERRWRAFCLIKERTGKEPIVNAFVDEVRNPLHHFIEAFIDNLHRKNLIPLDEAAAYRKMQLSGLTITKVAAIAGKSYSHVDNYLRINALPTEVKALMHPENCPKDSLLGVNAAITIARSSLPTELKIAVAKEAIERHLGAENTRALVKMRTEENGCGVGGQLRKPTDDYKRLMGFLGYTMQNIQKFRNAISVAAFYPPLDRHGKASKSKRAHDAKVVRDIISHFTALLKDIEKSE